MIGIIALVADQQNLVSAPPSKRALLIGPILFALHLKNAVSVSGVLLLTEATTAQVTEPATERAPEPEMAI